MARHEVIQVESLSKGPPDHLLALHVSHGFLYRTVKRHTSRPQLGPSRCLAHANMAHINRTGRSQGRNQGSVVFSGQWLDFKV